MGNSPDRHSNARDRKRKNAIEKKHMRGNRSVFEIQKGIVARGRKAKGKR